MKKIIFYLALFILLSFSFAIAGIAGAAPSSEQGNKKTEIIKLSANMENIAKHLEFLGYRIEKSESLTTSGKPFFIAYSDTDNNLIVVETSSRFIGFGVVILAQKPVSADTKDFINRANSHFNIAKMYCSINDRTKNADLNFEAVYVGEYSKETFGSFLAMFKNDINIIRSMHNYEKIFLNK